MNAIAIPPIPVAIPTFREFPSIGRLSRSMIVTEKIDGTNAQVYITEDGDVYAGLRSRWITPLADNFGFAAWVQGNREDLLRLGPGSHFGEWWGLGIQRGYGLKEKRFSLFNVSRWADDAARPSCCFVVPTLAQYTFDTEKVGEVLGDLAVNGSYAAPGFMNPEGVVVFHAANGTLFKKTLGGDGHKGGGK